MMLDYFYGQSGELFAYYRIPKALFQDSRFRQLSTDTRTLYGILLDRMSLSAKNSWVDEHGRVYIIYTVREVQESLCCAEHKAVKLFRELEQADLVERKRRGLGRPSLIYVKNFSSGLPKAQMDAMKRTAGRPPKENPRQVVGNFETADLIGKESGESGRQVQRFIRLTNLIPELLDMVDEKKVSFNPAVELSYLSHEQQQEVINAMDDTQNAPSFSQAKRIKKLAQEGNFTSEAVVDIMGEEKKSEQDTVTIKNETLRKYFPRSYTPRQMEEKIIQLLDAWQKKRQRDNER